MSKGKKAREMLLGHACRKKREIANALEIYEERLAMQIDLAKSTQLQEERAGRLNPEDLPEHVGQAIEHVLKCYWDDELTDMRGRISLEPNDCCIDHIFLWLVELWGWLEGRMFDPNFFVDDIRFETDEPDGLWYESLRQVKRKYTGTLTYDRPHLPDVVSEAIEKILAHAWDEALMRLRKEVIEEPEDGPSFWHELFVALRDLRTWYEARHFPLDMFFEDLDDDGKRTVPIWHDELRNDRARPPEYYLERYRK